MILIEYTITHNMLNNILALEECYFKINNQKIIKSDLERLQTESLKVNLEVLAKSIQLQTTSEDMLKIFAGKVLPINLGDLKIISNYKNVCDYINSLKLNKTKIITLETVRHLNKVLGQDLFELWDLGKIRTGNITVNNSFDGWSTYYTKTTKVSNNVRQHLVQHFHGLLSETIKMNGVLRASLLMAILLISYPFVTLNQLTILVTVQTILEIEFYNKRRIWSCFDMLEYMQHDLNNLITKKLVNTHKHAILDITEVCELIVYHLSKSMHRLYQTIQSDQKLKLTQRQGKIQNLNARQKHILRYLAHNEKITTSIYCQKTGATAMSASRDCRGLIKCKLIKRWGKGRGVYYTNYNFEEEQGHHLASSTEDDTLSVYEDKYFTEVRSVHELID